LRTRPERLEPEIYFRIVHLAGDSRHGTTVVTDNKQKVEIALGHKGTFENGNIGALLRHARTNHFVNAFPPLRRNPKPPKELRAPRVVKLLHNAIEWRRQLDAGEVRTQADIARREGITRARVTQVMRLLRLAPEFQEQILSMPDISRRSAITERQLRPMIIVAEGARQEKPIASFMP